MAASPPRFAWTRCSLAVERSLPEGEGPESEERQGVRVVCGLIRGELRARVFDSNGRRLAAATVIEARHDSKAGTAELRIALPEGGEERWAIRREGGCGCG